MTPGRGKGSTPRDRWVGIDVPDDLHEQLLAWADIKGVTVDELLDRVLREYLSKRGGRQA